jgi:hypothetical protein
MHIRETRYPQRDPLKTGSVDNTRKAENGASAHPEQVSETTSVPQDRVEISHAARTALADEQNRQTRDLAFAQKALKSLPPLTENRAADIFKRIQEGHYNQPDAIKEIAQHLHTALTGTEPE